MNGTAWHQVKRVMDELDKQMGLSETDCSEVETGKFRLRTPKLQVDVVQPGGTSTTITVLPRFLSDHGISFLYHGFLHHGTRCSMALITVDNARRTVKGVVSGCRFVSGYVHEAEVIFDEPIGTNQFIRVPLSVQIGVLECESTLRALLTVHLQRAGAQVVTFSGADDLVSCVSKSEIDLDVLLIDLDNKCVDAVELLTRLQKIGCHSPIIGTSSRIAATRSQRFLDLGCVDVLEKPFDRDGLLDTVREHSLTGVTKKSKFLDDPSMAALMEGFLKDLPQKLGQVQKGLMEDRIEDSITILDQIKAVSGGSAGLGFDQIATKAGEMISLLEAEPLDTQEVIKTFGQLHTLCRSAHASTTA